MSDTFPPAGYIPVESKVPGIQVFMPAPKVEEDQREVVTFDCPQCGATTAYSSEEGGLTCAHCGFYEPPKVQVVGRGAQQFEFTLETMEKAAYGWGEARRELDCQNCGARTSMPMQELTHTCTFCGSNKVVQRDAAQDSLRPRFLIPLLLTDPACRELAKKWLGSSWMTPATLSRLADIGAFSAVYLPYWTFDAVTRADWKAEVGHTESESYYDSNDKSWKTRSVTVWRWESGQVQLTIDDLLVPGTSRLSAYHLEKTNNFDLHALTAYEPKFLAGQKALGYDVPLEKAWELGRHAMRERTRDACRDQASTSQIRNFSMALDFSDESWRYILLPVYVAAYRYEDKVYQVVVNGQTGSISGQRPVDWGKVWLAIGGILSPGILMSLLGLITLPLAGTGVVIGGVGLVLLIIGIVISIVIAVQANELNKA